MRPNPQFPVDLVTFTEEIFNGKLHFLCSDYIANLHKKTKLEYFSIYDSNNKTLFWVNCKH